MIPPTQSMPAPQPSFPRSANSRWTHYLEDDGNISDAAQNPKRLTGLKRKLVVAASRSPSWCRHRLVAEPRSRQHPPTTPPSHPLPLATKGRQDLDPPPLEADGWNEGDGEFSSRGRRCGREGGLRRAISFPARTYPSTCPREPTRWNVTSILTAKDGSTTWLVPDAVDFTVEARGHRSRPRQGRGYDR